MAFIHGRDTKIMYHKYDLTSYFRSASRSTNIDLAETSTYSIFDKSYVVGFRDSTIGLEGVFDASDASALSPVLSAELGTSTARPLTVALHHPWATGGACMVAGVLMTSYSVSAPYSDMVSANADFQATGGAFDGFCLMPGTSITTAATTNGASHDNAVATTAGLVANLHVPTNTFATSLAATIKGSTDNSVFAALSPVFSFTSLGAASTGSETKRSGSTVSVGRYARLEVTTVGAGAATVYSAYARPAV